MIEVELARALAWPSAAVILGFTLRTDARAFFTTLRTRGFSVKAPGGFEATVAAVEQQKGDNPTKEGLELQKPVVEPSPRPAVNIMELRIRGDLDKIEAAKRVAVLLRALAQSRLEAGHEFTYNRIFGSQIAALKRLNEVGHASIEDARKFFEPYAQAYPQVYANYGFQGWLGFLLGNSLASQTGDILQITDFARDFLVYLTERRLAENKPG